jgi:outer membrane protein assembly factor BamC
MNLQRLALALAILAVTSGCSWFGSKNADYKGAAARASQPLEVPPELTRPTVDDRYAIPDAKSQTTYSAYTQRGTAPVVPGAPDGKAVLPKIEGARLERVGDQRWLIVKGEPAAVWPIARDFWAENGFVLVKEERWARSRPTSGPRRAATSTARAWRRARSSAPPRSS